MLQLVCTECLRFPPLGVGYYPDQPLLFLSDSFWTDGKSTPESVVCAGAAGKGGRDMGKYNYFFWKFVKWNCDNRIDYIFLLHI